MSAVSDLRQKYATAMQFREDLDEGYSTLDLSAACIIHLTDLLDIVEEVAAYDCPPDPEAGWGFCMYCAADTESEPHTPDCAYRRARELCGKDGAS